MSKIASFSYRSHNLLRSCSCTSKKKIKKIKNCVVLEQVTQHDKKKGKGEKGQQCFNRMKNVKRDLMERKKRPTKETDDVSKET